MRRFSGAGVDAVTSNGRLPAVFLSLLRSGQCVRHLLGNTEDKPLRKSNISNGDWPHSGGATSTDFQGWLFALLSEKNGDYSFSDFPAGVPTPRLQGLSPSALRCAPRRAFSIPSFISSSFWVFPAYGPGFYTIPQNGGLQISNMQNLSLTGLLPPVASRHSGASYPS